MHANARHCDLPTLLNRCRSHVYRTVLLHIRGAVWLSNEKIAAMLDTSLPEPYYNPGDSVETVRSKVPLPRSAFALYEVPNSAEPGYLPVIRTVTTKDGLSLSYHPEICSVYSLFLASCRSVPERPLFLHRSDSTKPYKAITYRETHALLIFMGLAIMELLGSTAYDSIVTIYMPNMWQFAILDFGCQAFLVPTTCLYDLLGADLLPHIFGISQLPIVFTIKDKVKTLLSAQLDTVKYIVVCEPLGLKDAELITLAKKSNIALLDFELVLSIGKNNPHQIRPPTLDTILTISFTSGTTSLPKGVITTHRGMTSSVSSCYLSTRSFTKRHNDGFLFLPLAHCYLRFGMYFSICLEDLLYFPTNPLDVSSYFADIKVVKPAMLCIVPRVLTKLEAALQNAIRKSSFVSKMVQNRIDKLRNGQDPSNFIFDNFLLKRFRAAVGFDNMECVTSGSAPIAPETFYFIRAVLNIEIHCGYGLTEALALATVSSEEASTDGTLGFSLEYKLKDASEMGYTWKENRSGELLIRGPALCVGYMGAEDAYQETCENNWFRTGDIITINENGTIQVLDRIKNFFKLSQGKFIASEKVQNVYLGRNPELEQIFVYGDGLKSYLVGIVGINVAAIGGLLLEIGVQFVYNGTPFKDADFVALSERIANKKAEDQLVKELIVFLNQEAISKKVLGCLNSRVDSSLVSYEKVKNAFFTVNPFTMEDGTIGPTLKLKRPLVKEKFHSKIEELYLENEVELRPRL